MPETPPISIRNIGSSGIILDDVVDESLTPTGSVSWAINWNFDTIGAGTIRKGYSLLGAQVEAGASVVGLHQFLDTGTGTNDRLIAVVDTTLYALVSGAWTSKRTSLTADSQSRFTNFVDLVFMVNGQEAMQSWNGGAGNFSTSQVTSAPVAYFIDNFRTRVWAAKTDANPSRVIYSSVADSSGNILWSGDDFGFIDVAPGDGEDITGIKKFDGTLWIAKPSTMYRIFSVNESEPDPRVFVGTYSQESMEVAKDGLYWHHPSGIYRVRKGENQPTEISRPIYTIIKNISRANYDTVASWSDDDHVYFSVGNVTVSGVTITNCTIRWTISTEVWTVYSHNDNLLIGNSYDDGSTIYRVAGDSDGNVYLYDNTNTDNGTPISYDLITRWYNVSGLRSETKTIREISAFGENFQGANIQWFSKKTENSEYNELGSISGDETLFKNRNITGKRFKFRVSGVNSGDPPRFQGFEINNWINEGVIE